MPDKNKINQEDQPNQPNQPGEPDKNKFDPAKKHLPDGTEEPSKEANREANIEPDRPDNAPKFDDNPDETKRKIPNL